MIVDRLHQAMKCILYFAGGGSLAFGCLCILDLSRRSPAPSETAIHQPSERDAYFEAASDLEIAKRRVAAAYELAKKESDEAGISDAEFRANVDADKAAAKAFLQMQR